MNILQLNEPGDWTQQIRKIPPMEKWFFRLSDKPKITTILRYLKHTYGMKYVTKQWDRDLHVLIILEEWQ